MARKEIAFPKKNGGLIVQPNDLFFFHSNARQCVGFSLQGIWSLGVTQLKVIIHRQKSVRRY